MQTDAFDESKLPNGAKPRLWQPSARGNERKEASARSCVVQGCAICSSRSPPNRTLPFGNIRVYTLIMAVDLLASMGLTVCAAIAISALAIGFGEDALARVRVAAVFAAWFLLVTMLAASEVLHDQHGVGVISLGLMVLLPMVILSVIVLRSVRLHEAFLKVPLALLIGVNTIRILGVVFLVLYAAGRLPGPFAPVAGWGDILVGLTAAPLAWFAHKKPWHARPVVWAWNALGLADLVAAVSLGATSAPGPLRLIFAEPGTAMMSTLPWLLIPGFLVPF